MAAKLTSRIARAVNRALLERDRAEMRAMGTVLELMEPPRRRKARRRPARRQRR